MSYSVRKSILSRLRYLAGRTRTVLSLTENKQVCRPSTRARFHWTSSDFTNLNNNGCLRRYLRTGTSIHGALLNSQFCRGCKLRHQARCYSKRSEQFCINKNSLYLDYLTSLDKEYEQLTSAETSEFDKHKSLRLMEIKPCVLLFQQIQQHDAEMKELDSLISGADDAEIIAMARKERVQLVKDIEEEETQLVALLAGHSKMDQNDIILELSAGVGGQEAMLFTGEMFRMYERFADYMGWDFEEIGCEISESGGLRRASASITGENVFSYLKFEGGVHRVQRVPQTEKSGRVHTSTMTVAILPQPDEIDVVIHPKDLHVETFRASGKGGQHVNTTDSAVRITHLPTKTVAECQVGRSQLRNREMALQILRTRMYEAQLRNQTEQTRASRRMQTGTAGRSEKIRTYNFPQDRITDHRLGQNLNNLQGFFTGAHDLEELIHDLMWNVKQRVVLDILSEFESISAKKMKT